MASPLSPIIADIVMKELIKNALDKSSSQPKVIIKYVDDIFAVVKTTEIDNFLKILNNYHDRLHFTAELEENGKLPYLDALVIREKGRLKLDWYRKKALSGKILHFESAHPKQQIINTASNTIQRILSIGDDCFREKNEKVILDMLTKNGFPRKAIKGLIK